MEKELKMFCHKTDVCVGITILAFHTRLKITVGHRSLSDPNSEMSGGYCNPSDILSGGFLKVLY